MSQQTKPLKEICLFCNKAVFFNEKVSVDNVAYHINCFRCSKCKTKINPLSYGKMEGRFYCKTHFEEKKKEIMLRINFTEGLLTTTNFSKTSFKSPRKQNEVNKDVSPLTSPRKEEIQGNVKEFAKKYESIKQQDQKKETVKPKIAVQNENQQHKEETNPFYSPRTENNKEPLKDENLTPRVEEEKIQTPRKDENPLYEQETILSPKKKDEIITPRMEEEDHHTNEDHQTKEEEEEDHIKEEEEEEDHIKEEEDHHTKEEDDQEKNKIESPKRQEEPITSPTKEVEYNEEKPLSPIIEEIVQEEHISSPRKVVDVEQAKNVDHTEKLCSKYIGEDSKQDNEKEEIDEEMKTYVEREEEEKRRSKDSEEIYETLEKKEEKIENEEKVENEEKIEKVQVEKDEKVEKEEKEENKLNLIRDIKKESEEKDEKNTFNKVIRKSIGETDNLSKSFSEKLLGKRKSIVKKTGDFWIEKALDKDEEFKIDFGQERRTTEKLGEKKKEKKDKKKDKEEEKEEKEEKKPSKFNLFGLIKGAVSKNKKRFQEDGFDLDLSYITDQVIAMGFPSQGIEATYRNSMHDVIAFLEKKHKDRYMVYNLCSEKLYDSESFKGRVDNFGFDDHNPPPLIIMRPLCNNINTWLQGDSKRVAVVHCKAGKGRTGTIIAAYLIHIGACKTAEEALELFSKKRTKDGKGVTIPSQIRYVYYYDKCMKKGFPRKDVPLIITQIKWNQAPFGQTTPSLKVLVLGLEVFNMKDKCDIPTIESDDIQTPVIFNFKLEVKGDFKVVFTNGDDKFFHFWLNTNMIEGDKQLLLRDELDGGVKKDKGYKKFPSDFALVIKFEKKQ